MKNELTVLKSIRHCKTIAKKLDEECKNLALSSFCAVNFQNGTLGQMQAIAELVYKRNLTEQYYETVVKAIGDMPSGYRALMFAVYVKKTSKTELCQKYGVSLSTIYRKLELSRKLFAKNLQNEGAEEEWFQKVYGALTKFYSALKNCTFDDAFDCYCNALSD